MPSPFPGRDPFLESPDWFADLHDALQVAFDRAYDAGPYQRAVRYDATLRDPPLTQERADWVKSQLATTV
jgi:Protein of unknown function (DUF4058)